jgi:hypothetical protein
MTEVTIEHDGWEWTLFGGMDVMGRMMPWHVQKKKVGGKYMECYGPYDTHEEAKKAANFPKPKTEVEELWEVLDRVDLMLRHYEIRHYETGYLISTSDLKRVLDEIKAARKKWKPETTV